MAALLRREGRDPDVELSVLFCDDPVIQSLNWEYRGLDQPTDVLSFPQEEDHGQSAVRVPGQPIALGDVVISLETARRHASAQKHSLGREVEWLLLHGVLHLLGYDDATEEGLQTMLDRQDAVLKGLSAVSDWQLAHKGDHQSPTP